MTVRMSKVRRVLDVSGFLLTNSVSTMPTADALAHQNSMNSLQNAVSSPTRTGGTLSAGLLQGLMGTWPAR